MDQNHSVTPTKLEKGDSAISCMHQVQQLCIYMFKVFNHMILYGILKILMFWFLLIYSSTFFPSAHGEQADCGCCQPIHHCESCKAIWPQLCLGKYMYIVDELMQVCSCYFHLQHPISKDFPTSCPSTGLIQWWWFLGSLDGLFLPGPDCCGHRTASTASTLAHMVQINALIMKACGR